KALQESVISLTTRHGAPKVLGQGTGLNSAQQRNRHGRDMDGSAPDAVVGVMAIATPRFKVESAVVFMSFLVQRAQPPCQFVPEQEQAARILVEQFSKLLYRRVV